MQPAIYDLIAREKIADILRTLSVSIGLPVRLEDPDGAVLETYGADSSACGLPYRGRQPGEGREKEPGPADSHTTRPGEAGILTCHDGAACIAYPVSHRGKLAGTVFIGPFMMEPPHLGTGYVAGEKQNQPSVLPVGMFVGLTGTTSLTPEKAAHIGKLAGHLLGPLLPNRPMDVREGAAKEGPQPRISQVIRMLSALETHVGDKYPFEKERELLAQVKTGNPPAARATLNYLLAYVLLHRDGQLGAMKNRALELATLLSRVAVECGALTDSVFRTGIRLIAALQGIDNIDALCFKLQEVAETFMETMFLLEKQGGIGAVRQAMQYVAQHYPEPLSLEHVAEQVRLSPAYFSSLFRKTTGAGFAEYLNRVRVEEGKRLLSSTDLAIVDIAVPVAYADQSYFSKVCKKYTGLSPRLYR